MNKAAEEKVMDTYRSAASIYQTSSIRDDLCQIPQGSDFVDRIGLTIKPCSLSLKVIVASNAAAATSSLARLIVFQSKKAETSVPADSDLIQDVLGSGSSAMIVYNHVNWTNANLYHVLLDDVFVTSKPGQFNDIIEREYMINLDHADSVDYLDASAALTGNKGGRIYCYLVSGESNTIAQTVTYHARLVYKDV